MSGRGLLLAVWSVVLALVVGCGGEEKETTSVFVILDVSESTLRVPTNTELLRESLKSVTQYGLEERIFLTILPVGSLTAAGPIFSEQMDPSDEEAENEARVREWYERTSAKIAKGVGALESVSGAPETDLIAGLNEARRGLSYRDADREVVVFVSDMVQTAGESDMENYLEGDQIDEEAWVDDAQAELIEGASGDAEPLDGSELFVVLLQHEGSSKEIQVRSVVEPMWSSLFERLGGHLRAFDANALDMEEVG